MADVVQAVSRHLSHRNDLHGRNSLLSTYIQYQALVYIFFSQGVGATRVGTRVNIKKARLGLYSIYLNQQLTDNVYHVGGDHACAKDAAHTYMEKSRCLG
jgi:hypothetical protein